MIRTHTRQFGNMRLSNNSNKSESGSCEIGGKKTIRYGALSRMSWKLGGKSRVVRKEVGEDDREQGKISDKVWPYGLLGMNPSLVWFKFDESHQGNMDLGEKKELWKGVKIIMIDIWFIRTYNKLIFRPYYPYPFVSVSAPALPWSISLPHSSGPDVSYHSPSYRGFLK